MHVVFAYSNLTSPSLRNPCSAKSAEFFEGNSSRQMQQKALAIVKRSLPVQRRLFCTERRLLWLDRPGRKALARQAFSGRGGSPKPISIAG